MEPMPAPVGGTVGMGTSFSLVDLAGRGDFNGTGPTPNSAEFAALPSLGAGMLSKSMEGAGVYGVLFSPLLLMIPLPPPVMLRASATALLVSFSTAAVLSFSAAAAAAVVVVPGALFGGGGLEVFAVLLALLTTA